MQIQYKHARSYIFASPGRALALSEDRGLA